LAGDARRVETARPSKDARRDERGAQ
jgi:hypothetical protein